MQSVWATIQGIGAISGLISAVFGVINYLRRGHPIVYLGNPHNKEDEVLLIAHNRSNEPIEFGWKTNQHPNELIISRSTATHDVIVSNMYTENRIVIDGLTKIELPVYKPQNFKEISLDGEMFSKICWEYVQPKFYKRSRKLTIKIRKDKFIRLGKAVPGLQYTPTERSEDSF